MKIVLSEQQLERVLSELYGKDSSERLMDKILDKVSGDGISSLSSEDRNTLMKLSRGEKISDESSDDVFDEESTDMDEPLDLFLKIFPDGHEIDVDGNRWAFNVYDTDDGVTVFITDSDANEVSIVPFIDGDKMSIQYKDKSWVVPIKSDVPFNIESMKKFIDQLIGVFIPSLIKKVVKKNEI